MTDTEELRRHARMDQIRAKSERTAARAKARQAAMQEMQELRKHDAYLNYCLKNEFSPEETIVFLSKHRLYLQEQVEKLAMFQPPAPIHITVKDGTICEIVTDREEESQ